MACMHKKYASVIIPILHKPAEYRVCGCLAACAAHSRTQHTGTSVYRQPALRGTCPVRTGTTLATCAVNSSTGHQWEPCWNVDKASGDGCDVLRQLPTHLLAAVASEAEAVPSG